MGKVKIVSASAGSGKTYNLAYEYIRNVIANPTLYNHILAVTFTNKATDEMKQRILQKINTLASGLDDDYFDMLEGDLHYSREKIAVRAAEVQNRILHDYSHFAIVTIDKFFQRIIRSFIKELGIDLNFNLELPIETLLAKASDRLIEDITTNAALKDWIVGFADERIADSKKWNIQADLSELGAEIFKEEYKNRTAADEAAVHKDRLKQLVGEAHKSAAKARESLVSMAKEMLSVAEANGLGISDFSGGQRGAFGYVAKVAAGKIEAPGKSVENAMRDNKWCTATSPHRSTIDGMSGDLHARMTAMCEAYESSQETINTAVLLQENFRNYALLNDLKVKIAEVSREENIVHISEINEMLSKLISGNDTPFIFEKAGNYYSHFMIDEFQDTSSRQWRNFIPLLKNATSQSQETPVMLVGDVKQSIYRWRGGDWGILAGSAAEEFPENEQAVLDTNYRSLRNIVDFNNALVCESVRLENDNINTALAEALRAGSISKRLHDEFHNAVMGAYSDSEQKASSPHKLGYATVTYYGKGLKKGEAIPPVIETINDLQSRGFAPRDIAILVRQNKEAEKMAEILLQYKNTNPDTPFGYDVVTQDALTIGNSPIANFLAAGLGLAADLTDNISLAVYNKWLGRGFGSELPEEEAAFFSNIRLRSPEEAFEGMVIRYRLDKRPDDLAFVQSFHDQIIGFSRNHIADIRLFLNWWHDAGSRKSISIPAGGNAITIDTIHRSKGLGYKAVIIPYCDWSMNPKSDSIVWTTIDGDNGFRPAFPVRFKKAMARSVFSEDYYREYILSHIDNMNLLYVAVTRAREELHIMIPEASLKTSERISTLIYNVVDTASQPPHLGILPLSVESEETTVAKYGTLVQIEQAKRNEERFTIDYTTVDTTGRMAVKTNSERYVEDAGNDGTLLPRNYGILLHKAFEGAETTSDINRNLDAFASNGIISPEERDMLASNISSAMEQSEISAFFDGSWDAVYNERDIIAPGNHTYRPDRVVSRGGSAMILDYKFGLKALPSYRRQIDVYASLLKSMGYSDVAGFIWYVNLRQVEKVG